MRVLWQQLLASDLAPWLGALAFAALSCALAAWALRARRRPSARLTSIGATALLAATVGLGALAADPGDPVWQLATAIDEVAAGDPAHGCAGLRDVLGRAPEAIERVDGSHAAAKSCVDRELDAALALSGSERERALLALAHPEAPLPLDDEQWGRVGEALAEFPKRARLRSIEVAGPRSIISVRRAVRARLPMLAACRSAGVAGILTARLAADADGRIARARTVQSDTNTGAMATDLDNAPVERCLTAALGKLVLEPADGYATVTLELRLMP